MAEAATIPTTPKQIGKQLRAVRRRKGLSLSEVARGAGLSRRELVAYERGKVPIPESDLWVLAGSCGVDVAELTPEHSAPELEAGPATIGDSIAFLRRGQRDGASGGRRLRALETGTDSAESEPAHAPYSSPAPVVTPEPARAAPVDVFEELARLPEPVPLNPDPDDYPDLLAPPAFLAADAAAGSVVADPVAGPPAGMFETVDNEPFAFSAPSGALQDVPAGDFGDLGDFGASDAPMVVDATPDVVDRPWTPADAPPIDVALRGETYASDVIDEQFDAYDPSEPTTAFQPQNLDLDSGWATDGETAVQPDWTSVTSGVWNEPDVGTGEAEWWVDAGTTTAFAAWDSSETLTPLDDEVAPTDFTTLVPRDTAEASPPGYPEPWAHEPDPEATSTGFLVDWGDPEPPAAFVAEPYPEDFADQYAEQVTEPDAATLADEPPAWEPVELEPIPGETTEPDDAKPEDAGTLMPISWHPELAERTPLGASAAEAPALPATSVLVADDPRPDEWVTAGDEWELGNALPLVEVRGQGALVMRRADERWALADLTVAERYVVEVDLELRSGPGFGVLFRADVDDEGRMSAYSFDVDPAYEGGGYLVRQWQADRELWNPIAHVGADDPTSMYGELAVRLEVGDEHLVASVNNTVVMIVDDLHQASVDRGRDAPNGRRVGVQAWSSSDLVVETLRVADRH